MPFTTTTNMGLTIPTVSLEPGPTWAIDINASLNLVDAHDHSVGKGVRLNQSSILFTADFSANSFGISNLKNLALVLQSGTLTAQNSLYTKSTGDLVYVDASGNQIQLTINGAPNSKGIGGNYVTDAAAPSVFYTTATLLYTFTTNGTILANVKLGGLQLGVVTVAAVTLTIGATDPTAIVLVNTSTNTVGITMPTAAAAGVGRIYTFKDISGAAATRNITISRASADLIDGVATLVINTNRGVARIVSDGVSAWSVI